MTRNIYEPSLYTQVNQNKHKVKLVDQTPGAFKWWTPDCDPDDDDEAADGCTGDEPTLENGWAQVTPPLEKFSFRLHSDGSLEFKGHLDAAGASSGTVAFTLPGLSAGETIFVLPNDQYFITAITDDSGATFTTALVFLDSTTGEVTITWPAS